MKICDLKRYVTLNIAAYLSLYFPFEFAVIFIEFYFDPPNFIFCDIVCLIGLLILFFIPFCLLVLFPLELLIAFLLKKWFPNKFKKADDKRNMIFSLPYQCFLAVSLCFFLLLFFIPFLLCSLYFYTSIFKIRQVLEG